MLGSFNLNAIPVVPVSGRILPGHSISGNCRGRKSAAAKRPLNQQANRLSEKGAGT